MDTRAGSSRVVAAVVDGPITPEREAAALDSMGWMPARYTPADGVGAAVRFEGIVRRLEPRPGPDAATAARQHDLIALDYVTYDPMAERELRALAHRTCERHALAALAVLHSRGCVIVGEVSFMLIVESAHRAEALAAMDEFIARMKQDIPIWKCPVWS